MSPTLPAIQEELGMAATSLQWVVGAIGAATLLALAMTARRASAPAIAEATSSESPSP
jgi:hypothetical protein